ncbi:MAG: hypothetical protein Q7U76_11385 [Nitrospirota bacterium]|nr:hypothetical protein [Nitrospirota bacterium]
MRQITLAALIAVTISGGLPAAHSMEASSGPDTIPPPLHMTTSQSSRNITNPSQPSSDHVAPLPQNTAPDCDGETPSSGSVTALLSRLVGSSSVMAGKRCPIPPIPGNRPIQEPHP